jgi:hypothetical protein
MPMPTGRPFPLYNPKPEATLSHMARDFQWAAEHGGDKNAQAPCHSARIVLGLLRRSPKTFWKLYFKVAYMKK